MNIKKTLLIWGCVLTSTLSFSQTLHNIMFCDTNDPNIGESVCEDNDRELDEIDDIAGYIGYKVARYVYNGSNCTKSNLMKVVNTIQTQSNDIIVFYYSGHGTHAPGQDNDKFPQMLLNSRYEGDFVPVRLVAEQLDKKPHGLLLILTDCCNNIVNGVRPKSALSQLQSTTIAKSSEAANYKRLFVESKGKIMATGCKLGQTSIALTKGGLFSICFWDKLYAECSQGNNPSWQNILRETTKETMAQASRLPRPEEQEPYFVIDIHSTNGGETTPVPIPTPPTPSNNNNQITTNTPLTNVLATILSQQDVSQRLNMIPQILNSHFPTGGHIVTLGRDLETVVDYEEAATFFRRIASSKKIVRINVIKEETASDGLPYITITEMRTE
ncbi:MAG: caspase family protein [Prevotella sp.]|nr:caspase family protein [Prevotella sp.]